MTDDAKLMPLYWGPGGPPRIRELVDFVDTRTR